MLRTAHARSGKNLDSFAHDVGLGLVPDDTGRGDFHTAPAGGR